MKCKDCPGYDSLMCCCNPVETKIAMGHCICAPRGLSIDPRCPIHKDQATFAEKRRYGLLPMDPQRQRELDKQRAAGVAPHSTAHDEQVTKE